MYSWTHLGPFPSPLALCLDSTVHYLTRLSRAFNLLHGKAKGGALTAASKANALTPVCRCRNCLEPAHTHACTHMYRCKHTCTLADTCSHTHRHTHILTHIQTHTSTHTQVLTHTHTHTHTCTHAQLSRTHTCTHTHTHAHKHTHSPSDRKETTASSEVTDPSSFHTLQRYRPLADLLAQGRARRGVATPSNSWSSPPHTSHPSSFILPRSSSASSP